MDAVVESPPSADQPSPQAPSPAPPSTEQQASGSSFYAAMRLLPPAERAAMFAIYAFCRVVDDVADEPGRRRKTGARS
jgi:phytoene synthase